VELLVAVSICGILMSLALPAIHKIREAARQTHCRNNLRQVALGLHNYESVHSVFPPGSQVQDLVGGHQYSKSFGWTIALMPYVEFATVYTEFNWDVDCQIHHRELTALKLPIYVCPSDPNHGMIVLRRVPHPIWGTFADGKWGTTNYLGVSGTDLLDGVTQPTACTQSAGQNEALHSGVFFGNSSIRISDVTDGSSNTAFVAERGVALEWGKWGGAGVANTCPSGIADVLLPGVITNDPASGGLRRPKGDLEDRFAWWSWHSAGTHFSFVDGSVGIVSDSVDFSVLTAFSTRSGSESF